MSNQTEPTTEQKLRACHLGAKAALSHLPEQQRAKLLAVHAPLAARRERNRSEFKAKVLGGSPS